MESPDYNLEIALGLISPFQICQVGMIMSTFLWRGNRSERAALGTCWEPQQSLPPAAAGPALFFPVHSREHRRVREGKPTSPGAGSGSPWASPGIPERLRRRGALPPGARARPGGCLATGRARGPRGYGGAWRDRERCGPGAPAEVVSAGVSVRRRQLGAGAGGGGGGLGVGGDGPVRAQGVSAGRVGQRGLGSGRLGRCLPWGGDGAEEMGGGDGTQKGGLTQGEGQGPPH